MNFLRFLMRVATGATGPRLVVRTAAEKSCMNFTRILLSLYLIFHDRAANRQNDTRPAARLAP
jgi:hypothetical protein